MPAPTIRADHELLKQAFQSFSRESAAINRSLDRLRSDMDTLQRGDWIGQGANRFYREMEAEVLPAVERLRSALDQGAQAAKQMSRIMEEAEAAAARLLGISAGAVAAGAGSAAAVGHALGQAVGAVAAAQPAGQQGEAGEQAGSDPTPQTLSQFDERVHELVQSSPTLQSQVERLRDAGWTVEIGPAGEGSYADSDTQTIVIDGGDTPASQVGGIAHEAAHALGAEPEFQRPTPEMNREQFIEMNVNQHLRDEANAQFHEAQVRHEIQRATGTDIGISGVQSAEYGRIYREFSEGDITREQAIDQMTTVFGEEVTSTTGENYRDYYAETYENWWDEHEAARRQNQ